MKRWYTRLLLLTWMFALGAHAAFAQGVTTGAISGTVTGPQGEPVSSAQIVITNRATGYSTGTLTRSNGQYIVQGLEVGGPYTVRVSSIGFQQQERADIFVRLSAATRVDFAISVQAVELESLDITVTRTADFTPTRQGVSVAISDTLVQRVPTLSRDFVDQLKLAPQVTYSASGGAASGGGAYNRFNTITLDGANQSERFNLGSTGGVPGGSAGGKIVSIDAIKEFRVMFTPTDVRQGNFAGMLVNAVSKSGTNEWDGGGTFTYRSNEDLLGLNLVGEDLRAGQFDVKQYGFYLGGPIIRDRLHFFIAPEFQERARPAGGPSWIAAGQSSLPNESPAIPLDSLARISNIMQTNYGFDVGATAPVSNENPLTNLFGRIDFRINPDHRLVLRQIINYADDDVFSRNTGNLQTSALNQSSGYRFGSNGYTFATENFSTVAQLYSNFRGGKSNELIIGYNKIDARRETPVNAPEIAVGVNVGGVVRAATLGTEQFSPNNILTQDIYEVVNNFTMPFGAHTFTFGARLDHTHIFNNFAQGINGVYVFPTIAALNAGTPSSYAVGYANSRNAGDIPADFRVQMYSLYAQDQWSINDRLTITAGLRADIPNFLDKPSQNDTITALLRAAGGPDVRTDAVPKSRPLWSPRFGFNFDPTGDQRNQVRGGIGIYTGPPPYIMLGNAYANTGLGLVRLICSGAGVPRFTLNVDSLPTACAGQAEPAAGAAGTAGINVNDPDFKYPQYFGVSGGLDRQLPWNMVLTFEGLYRKAINGVLIRDANFRGPRIAGGVPYTDRNGRVLYADTILANGNSCPFGAGCPAGASQSRYITSVRGTSFAEGIIEVTNQSEDFNYSLSTQLAKRFSDRFEATVAYTYMKSEDVQSLTSDRAISNWRNGRQLSEGHEDLQTSPSVWDRPHRFVAYGTYTLPWKITDVTLYYERTSGAPFTYVAQGDLNGDGYNGNDPIYVPNDARNASEMQIGAVVSGAFVQDTFAARVFDDFIGAQDCLNEQRGQIMKRNSCRSPAQSRMDLSIRQSIPQIRGQQISVQLDIFNFLNFLNNDWGQIKLPTLSPTFPDQRALVQTARSAGPLNQSLPVFRFDNRLYNTDADDGAIGDLRIFEGRSASVYQIQLVVRYSF